jgi:hypothetical protein
MTTTRYLALLASAVTAILIGCDGRATAKDKAPAASTQPATTQASSADGKVDVYKNVKRADHIDKSDAEWKKQLTAEAVPRPP